MTSIKEYIAYGLKKEELLEALTLSALSKNSSFEDVVYVGVPNASFIEDDGSAWGRYVKRAKEIVLLTRYVIEQTGKLKGRGKYAAPIKATRFKTAAPRKGHTNWYTGNGNATLSPWDCERLLADYKREGGAT